MKKILFLFIPLLIFTVTFLQAQEQGNKIVIINLKNGYAVKGTIVEQNDKLVKIKVQDGQILEYSTTEIESVGSKNVAGKSSTNKTISKIYITNDKIVDFGFGIGSKLVNGQTMDQVTFPATRLVYEQIIKSELFDANSTLGIGGYIGFSSSKYTSYGNYINKNKTLFIGPRVYLHYGFVDKLDTYGGIFLGYHGNFESYPDSDYVNGAYVETTRKVNDGKMAIQIFAGGRYYLNEKFAAFAELSWGLALLNFGVAMKL